MQIICIDLERVRKMLSARCASQFVGDLRQMKEA